MLKVTLLYIHSIIELAIIVFVVGLLGLFSLGALGYELKQLFTNLKEFHPGLFFITASYALGLICFWWAFYLKLLRLSMGRMEPAFRVLMSLSVLPLLFISMGFSQKSMPPLVLIASIYLSLFYIVYFYKVRQIETRNLTSCRTPPASQAGLV